MSLQALLDTMTALNEVHTALLELAEQKKQVLIHNKVDELTQIVNKENKLLKRVGELDAERVERTGQFLIEKGYKPNPRVTISDLAKILFVPEEKRTLMDAQKQLLGTVRRLREINTGNQQLLEQALAFVDYSLDLFVGPPEDEVIYQKPHQHSSGAKRPGLFDARA
ncbi:flagellar protein FlgN [Paenibacillus cremeus]|uniref:Flagellar protein FlgN n=1 Tax=Paenibacillus cremeus TaxID=2163881 RepID=A0A559KB26_9BACL|nr:flagellar protein FlgN [Paenibacillus cremeus]TVY09332.1 flagellar protein FlgN [Paenibacillus cremeus]